MYSFRGIAPQLLTHPSPICILSMQRLVQPDFTSSAGCLLFLASPSSSISMLYSRADAENAASLRNLSPLPEASSTSHHLSPDLVPVS